jgi:serine/threonine-protein kinase
VTDSRDRYTRLKDIVIQARALPPAERGRHLDAACAGDAELRRDAEALLAHDVSVNLLKTGAFGSGVPTDEATIRIGRYEVQRRLGVGGMGALYLARDPQLDRLVAIKLLKEELQEDSGLRERFLREARSVARLRHVNIVIVYDVGEDQGRPFMAMEYIAGETLGHVLRRQPLSLTRRLSFVEDLCAGLAHAHGAGIIHRDIKPANLMLDGDGVLKILDFGIARLGNSGMTQEGMMMGTVNYMSPEQVTGRGVDHRTDIFAAGAVLYEAIALEQAFPGRIDTGVLHRILTEGPVPLNQLVPSIDPGLLAIVQRAMDRDPAKRYQDAAMMRRDILRVRRRLIDQGGGPLLDSGVVTAISTPSTGRRPDSDRPRRLNPERFAELQRQQVAEHLRYGEEAFARGDHDAALHHAERAATVDPDSRDAFDLIDRARFAIEAKAVRQLLGQAQRLLAEGQLEEAAALADEASVTLPDVQGAAELRAEVRQVVESVTAARDREQRIVTSLERARASIERGGYETALRAVYEVLSIDPDRAEARTLEQRAQGGLQAQREHERARRGAHEQIARARALAEEGRFEEAIQAIESVAPPSDTVRVAVKEAQAFVRAAQRQAAGVAILAKARDAVDRGQFAEALAAIDSIPADEQTRDMKALRDGADRALREQRELERKRAALESAIAAIHELIDRGELGPAQERLTAAWTIGLSDERLPKLGSRIRHLTAEAEARRQQQVRDRLAAKRVEAARELLTNGDGYAAVTLLERDGSGHPLVAQALKEIRAAIAEQEERVRQEAERRRHEEEAQRRAAVEAARKLEEQRKAEEQRRRLDDERARREAERHRHREEVATLLIDAERALASARHDEATVLLNRADERVESAEDTELRRRVAEVRASAEQLARQQLEENRRRQEEARQQERALADLLERAHTTVAHEAALTILNEALTLAPTDMRVQQRVKERRDALERQRTEEARAREEARRREQEARQLEEEARRRAAEAARAREEAARLEREREAQRERDAQAAAVVEEARTLFSSGQHEEALTVLRASPIHALTQTAITELEARGAEIERQRQRETKRKQLEQRRAARATAIDSALRDRRVHIAAAALVVVSLVWAAWQYWPSSAPQVAVNEPAVNPVPNSSASSPPQAPPPVTTTPPAVTLPRATTPTPPAGARGAGAPTAATPIVGGRITPPANQPATAPPPVVKQPPASAAPQPAPNVPTQVPIESPAPAPQPQSPPQQPAVASPTTPTPSPPAEPRIDMAAERAAIQQLISRYAAAYGRLDETELRRIDPEFAGIPSRVLLKSLELTPSAIVVDVDPNGQTAKVRFTQNFRYEWNRPRMPPTQSGQVAWNLRKVAGVWAVVR